MTSRNTVLEFQFETWDRVFFHQGSLRELSGHAPRHLLQVTKCTSGTVLGTHLRTISGTTEKTVSQITFQCSVAHTKDWVDHTDPSHLRWQNHHSRSIHTSHSTACRGPPRCSLEHTCPVCDWCCQLVAWKLCQESWQDCVTTDWQKKKKRKKKAHQRSNFKRLSEHHWRPKRTSHHPTLLVCEHISFYQWTPGSPLEKNTSINCV